MVIYNRYHYINIYLPGVSKIYKNLISATVGHNLKQNYGTVYVPDLKNLTKQMDATGLLIVK